MFYNILLHAWHFIINVAKTKCRFRFLCDKKKHRENMATETKSRKDAFRERFSTRYPDVNMEDEDAYYGKAGEMMDDFDAYEKSTNKLRGVMDKSKLFAEMMIAARDTEDFDPLVWMVEEGGLDLDALRDDEEYSQKLGEARKKYLERMAKQEDIDKQVAENMPKTVEMVKQKQKELGLTDEQANEVVAALYKNMDDLIVGIINPEQFVAQAKAMNYEADLQAAHDEGVAQGLRTKVDDKLRTLNKAERNGGRQAAMQEPKPQKDINNPFLA